MLGDLRHFGDLLTRNARLFGDAEGLVLGDDRRSWRQAHARANRLAHALGRRGIRRGERVAVLSSNSVSFVEALFGLARSGLVAVPVNARLTAEEVARILGDCETAAMLVGDEQLELARDAGGRVASLRFVGGLGRGQGEIPPWEVLLDEGEEGEVPLEHPIAGDEVLMILYTSGTTGFPKGVTYAHRSALMGTLIHVHAIGSARHHRVLLPSPLYSAAGVAGIACSVMAGSASHLIQFTVEGALETLARERITFVNFVPTTVRRLLEHPDLERYDLSHLELLLYGGAPMPEPTLRRASDAFGCDFRQTFATSETGLSGTVLEPEDHRAGLADPGRAHLLRSCGKPQVGVGVRLVDEDWRSVPPGEIGEVAVRCDGNMVGYWNRPAETAAVMRGGEVRTGDLARRDEEGFHYLVDRKHDMIVSGAFNVYPTEVERVLVEHPAVAECAVVGLPDETWGEAVTAFVVCRPGSEVGEGELIDLCRSQLAGYKRPKSVVFIDEIPRNPGGKPLRRLLRQTRGVAAGGLA